MISHIGFIMDGNRRWAHQQDLPAFMGHQEGAQTVKTIIKHAIKLGIKWISLYTFSIENLKRSEQEKSFLFDLLAKTLRKHLQDFITDGARIRFIGDRSLFPASIRPACEDVEKETATGTGITIDILFCYGGQQEIIAATHACVQQVLAGQIKLEDITPKYFNQQLWSAPAPAPELIIRTGGMPRLSNFLLYQTAYSEIFFTQTLWPAFSVQELDTLIQKYQTVKRTFGK